MESKGKEKLQRLLTILAVILGAGAVAVGTYARFIGLDTWSLANDEYHTSQSVRFILEKGVPAFDCGGYYVRGIGFQYLLALFGEVFSSSSEALFRSVTAASFFVLLLAVISVTRRIGSIGLVVAAVVVISLSIIEIETARYIRPYAPFQAIFLVYLAVLLRLLQDRTNWLLPVLYGLSVVAMLIHETGIFLALLNFGALFWSRRKQSFQDLIIPAALLIACTIYLTIDFRFLGVSPADIEGLVSQAKGSGVMKLGPILLPNMILLQSAPTFVSMLAYFGLVLVLVWRLLALFRDVGTSWDTVAFGSILLILVLLNQFGVLLLLLISAVLLFEKESWWPRRVPYFRYVTQVTILGGAFWVLLISITAPPEPTFQSMVAHAKAIISTLLLYPDINRKIVYEWWSGQPIATAWLGLFAGYCLVYALINLNDERLKTIRLLLGISILLCMAVSALGQPYYSIRYSYFLYALLIILALAGMRYAVERTFKDPLKANSVFVVLLISMLWTSDDISATHIASIDSAVTNFRIDYPKSRQYQLWYRIDSKTPAMFVNAHAARDDKIASTVLAANYYLNDLDVVIWDSGSQEVRAIAGCGGERELWSGARLLLSDEEIDAWLSNKDVVRWLLVRNQNFPYQYEIEKGVAGDFAKYRIYTSVDQRIDVYRLPKDVD